MESLFDGSYPAAAFLCWIPVLIHNRLALQMYILGRHLPIGEEPVNPFLMANGY